MWWVLGSPEPRCDALRVPNFTAPEGRVTRDAANRSKWYSTLDTTSSAMSSSLALTAPAASSPVLHVSCICTTKQLFSAPPAGIALPLPQPPQQSMSIPPSAMHNTSPPLNLPGMLVLGDKFLDNISQQGIFDECMGVFDDGDTSSVNLSDWFHFSTIDGDQSTADPANH
jgi:hypothetical protein